VYIYIYICTHICIHIYIHTYVNISRMTPLRVYCDYVTCVNES